jgi:hypothetical protein
MALGYGTKRLWLYNTFVIMFAITVVTFLVIEMVCLTAENVDVRDMIDDHRLTCIVVEKQHVASFLNRTPRLYLCDW